MFFFVAVLEELEFFLIKRRSVSVKHTDKKNIFTLIKQTDRVFVCISFGICSPFLQPLIIMSCMTLTLQQRILNESCLSSPFIARNVLIIFRISSSLFQSCDDNAMTTNRVKVISIETERQVSQDKINDHNHPSFLFWGHALMSHDHHMMKRNGYFFNFSKMTKKSLQSKSIKRKESVSKYCSRKKNSKKEPQLLNLN